MTHFRLLEHTNTADMGTYAILPLAKSLLVTDSDYVQMVRRTKKFVELSDIKAIGQGHGKGLVLMHAAVTWAKDIPNLTGHFVTADADYAHVLRFYNRLGISIENGYLVGQVANILGLCTAAMYARGLSYELVR